MTLLLPMLYALGTVAIVGTLLPLWRTPRWWVRIWDFPRFQIAMAVLAIMVAWPVARWPTGLDWMFLATLAAVFLWQMSWVWRYLPGAPRQVRQAKASAGTATTIALLTANVLQTNRQVDRLIAIIMEADPDVILAVETDEWWCSELAAALGSRYVHGVQRPLSNGYGVALLSRLELSEPVIRYVIDEAIPSVRTGIKLRTGSVLDLYCVHPRPPALHQDTTERDTELVLIAREIKARGRPAILLGDLNDVAWSPSTLQFTCEGGLCDPRRGRGFYNTYPARSPGLRYPLDYIFNTSHFDVCKMRVLPQFGSDHLPLLVELHLRNERAR